MSLVGGEPARGYLLLSRPSTPREKSRTAGLSYPHRSQTQISRSATVAAYSQLVAQKHVVLSPSDDGDPGIALIINVWQRARCNDAQASAEWAAQRLEWGIHAPDHAPWVSLTVRFSRRGPYRHLAP